jgi:opacity protein-like surface antigen
MSIDPGNSGGGRDRRWRGMPSLIVLCFALLLVSEHAMAQSVRGSIRDNGPHDRPASASIMAWIPWWEGFGIGVTGRYEIPIVHDGFIGSINNSVSIEPSLGLAHTSYGYGRFGGFDRDLSITNITPAVYGLWSFYFSEDFRAYAAVGLGFNIGIVSDDYGTGYEANHFYWDLAAGLFYNVSSSIALRAELGNQGLKGGVAFLF